MAAAGPLPLVIETLLVQFLGGVRTDSEQEPHEFLSAATYRLFMRHPLGPYPVTAAMFNFVS